MIPYDIQTINSPNPLVRYSHRTRIKKCVQLADDLLKKNGKLLDFGAGEGFFFLNHMSQIRPDASYFAIDPNVTNNTNKLIHCIDSFSFLPSQMDIITAFETCEHLCDETLEKFLESTEKYLDDRGTLIISVPIMIGLSLPVKEISRMIATRKMSDYSAIELIDGTLGKFIERAGDRNASHKGFDFRVLRDQITKRFTINHEYYYPLKAPWWLNSQAVFVCKKIPGTHSGGDL